MSSRDSSRNAQVVRILQILRELDRLDGVDIYELAERHGTSVRTIRRDLEAIREAGVPLAEELVGTRKRWCVNYRAHQERLASLLEVSHYLALQFAMEQGGPVRKASSLFAALEDLAHKIETALSAAQRRQLRAINAFFYSYEKFVYQQALPDIFWPLFQAAFDHKLCKVTYRAPREPPQDKTFVVLPLRLFAHAGAAYLHAYVPKHDSVIALNLHRLTALEVLAKSGKPPANYDPGQWEAAAFGVYHGGRMATYRLKFAPAVAPYIRERTWHPSQKLRDLRGGSVELEFTCSESYEVTAWVASWRAHVEVLAPEALRKELGELGQWLAKTYEAT